jgi:copper chaperone
MKGNAMSTTFTVNDMTCNHCAGVITKAVKDVDANAKVDITVADKRVVIDSSLPAQSFAEAIEEAGYTPVAA